MIVGGYAARKYAPVYFCGYSPKGQAEPFLSEEPLLGLLWYVATSAGQAWLVKIRGLNDIR
jgi:hypothetical protein